MTTSAVESRLRNWLLILAGVVFLGTLIELWLEEHTKETIQYLPFGLCILGLITVIAFLRSPQRLTLLALRVSMGLIAAGGILGMGLHLYNNFLFEQEIRPNATTTELLVETLKGANPLVAPGILCFAAIIALLATYYHPALAQHPSNS